MSDVPTIENATLRFCEDCDMYHLEVSHETLVGLAINLSKVQASIVLMLSDLLLEGIEEPEAAACARPH